MLTHYYRDVNSQNPTLCFMWIFRTQVVRNHFAVGMGLVHYMQYLLPHGYLPGRATTRIKTACLSSPCSKWIVWFSSRQDLSRSGMHGLFWVPSWELHMKVRNPAVFSGQEGTLVQKNIMGLTLRKASQPDCLLLGIWNMRKNKIFLVQDIVILKLSVTIIPDLNWSSSQVICST